MNGDGNGPIRLKLHPSQYAFIRDRFDSGSVEFDVNTSFPALTDPGSRQVQILILSLTHLAYIYVVYCGSMDE